MNTASSPGASPENTREYQGGGETPDAPPMSLGTFSHPPTPSKPHWPNWECCSSKLGVGEAAIWG